MKKSSFLLIAALCFSLCTSAYAQDQNSLELPAIPKTLKAPAERADYLLEHFWDALDAATDNRSADSLFMEQTFVNFLSVMPHASAEGRAKGATAMYSKLKPSDKAKNLIRTLAEEYLYSPASPMRDENLYVLLLQSDAATADDDDASGIRNRELAKELLKNIPGTQAADFGIELANGATTTLRQVGGIPMLLLIYDPDCHTCHEAMEALANDADIQKAIADGKIAILAVETMFADVVLAGRTDTVTPPVSVTENQPVEARIVRVNTAAFSHGHVVRRVKAGSSDISPCPGKTGFSIKNILRTKSVAVVFHQPQSMSVTEGLYRL